MAPCKEGKEKNANGRCVKNKEECKEGKEKNKNGRCVKKCHFTQRRNKSGRCVRSKTYKKVLPIPAGKFRGLLLTKKRNLKHKSSSKHRSSSSYNPIRYLGV